MNKIRDVITDIEFFGGCLCFLLMFILDTIFVVNDLFIWHRYSNYLIPITILLIGGYAFYLKYYEIYV